MLNEPPPEFELEGATSLMMKLIEVCEMSPTKFST